MSTQHMQERFVFTSPAIAADACKVVRFSGTEGLNKLYTFEITLVCKAPVDVDTFMVSPATLSLLRQEGDSAHFHGFPTSCAQGAHINGWTFYTVHLCPRFARFHKLVQNHIFLDKNVQEIVETALGYGGTLKPPHEFKLQGRYPKHEFSMQYNESIYAYIAYHLERNGIYYYFDQHASAEKIVFTDSAMTHTALPATPTLRYSPTSGMEGVHREEVIVSFIKNQTQLPNRVYVRDYNWQNPNYPLEATATVSEHGLGELYFYGDGFTTVDEGKRLATIRAESLSCRGKMFTGVSSAPSVRPGYVFTLENHYDAAFNSKFLLTDVFHEGSQEAYLSLVLGIELEHPSDKLYYRNTFTCIPADVQFRPERVSERKKITGVINAFIDAASGAPTPEIDGYGRYKVIFPQDSSGRGAGKASCWVRRAQPSVGAGFGTSFPLEPGVEVLISFMDGDPDRPLIASAVSNAETGSTDSAATAMLSGISTAGGGGLIFNNKGSGQGFNLSTGSRRSGMFMASGSLDTAIIQTDFLSNITSATSASIAGISSSTRSGLEASMSVGSKGLSSSTVVKKVLSSLVKVMEGASNAAKQQASDDSSDASLLTNEVIWKGVTEGLKGVSMAVDMGMSISKATKASLPSSPYGTVLVSGEGENELSLQAKLSPGHKKAIIGLFTAEMLARGLSAAAQSVVEGVRTTDALEKIDEEKIKDVSTEKRDAQVKKIQEFTENKKKEDLEAERAQREKAEFKKLFADAYAKEFAKNPTKAQGDVYKDVSQTQTESLRALAKINVEKAITKELAEWEKEREKWKTNAENKNAVPKTDAELNKAKQDLIEAQKASKRMALSSKVIGTITPLIAELTSFLILRKKKNGPWALMNTSFGGMKLVAPENNVVMASDTDTTLSSNKKVTVLAFPGFDDFVDNKAAADLVKLYAGKFGMDEKKTHVVNHAEQLFNLAIDEATYYAGKEGHFVARDKVRLSNNATTSDKYLKDTHTILNSVAGAKTKPTAKTVALAAQVAAKKSAPRTGFSELTFSHDMCTLANTGKKLAITQKGLDDNGAVFILRSSDTVDTINKLVFNKDQSVFAFGHEGCDKPASTRSFKLSKDTIELLHGQKHALLMKDAEVVLNAHDAAQSLKFTESQVEISSKEFLLKSSQAATVKCTDKLTLEGTNGVLLKGSWGEVKGEPAAVKIDSTGMIQIG